MRSLMIVTTLAATIVLGGCGGSGGTPAATSTGAATALAVQPSSPGQAGGAVDCSSLTRDDLAKFLVYTQVLAQVRDQESAKAVRDGSFTDYKPAAMAAVLTKLSSLAGHPAPGFADPADSLAFFTRANEIMGRIVAVSGDIPQSLIDEYKAQVPDVGTALSHQLPINAAVSQGCPSVG